MKYISLLQSIYILASASDACDHTCTSPHTFKLQKRGIYHTAYIGKMSFKRVVYRASLLKRFSKLNITKISYYE